MAKNISLQQKLSSIYDVAKYRPIFTVGVIGLSVVAAILEGIGLTFILPIIRTYQGEGGNDSGILMESFRTAYDLIGIPFTLEYIILGVSSVMILRYTASFLVSWQTATLRTNYARQLREELYENALDAKISYFDKHGSDNIINAVITQSEYASDVIGRLVQMLEVGLVSLVYLSIALYLAPLLTLLAIVLLGISTYIVRFIFEEGFEVGSRVADANEQIQETVQAGIQGIRDIKLFGMKNELVSDFEKALSQYVDSLITQRRNRAGINNFHQLITAISVFLMIYAGLRYTSLSLGGLGVFLFAMFRLSPRVSSFNDLFYQVETDMPHLVRTQEFIQIIESNTEEKRGREAPNKVDTIEFNDVSFGYEESEKVLKSVSFEGQTNEFISFVGESGAGKSTIVSLLAQMYVPDQGEIRANGTPVREFDIESWRNKIAVVRQHPFIFNNTLRNNITIGHRDATEQEMKQASKIARVDEFLNELPEGYDTVLGDQGVRLSGGQKQRVALARALLKDADILVLDEATSGLDTNIEAEVQDAIEGLDREYIVITIAHRLSTIENSDRIYILENGRVTNVGSHEELLADEGKYAELYTS